MLFWGRWGTPIPHQKPMTLVVGKPVPVPAGEASLDAAVQKMHAEFIATVERLYELHKCGVGVSAVPLLIIGYNRLLSALFLFHNSSL
ncbi:hypothetical protein CLOP_g1434 [Closterium sp. NIES-67]|nr:hypothetical protein CLOP_g1434 [Closterium sp. NIES-67]